MKETVNDASKTKIVGGEKKEEEKKEEVKGDVTETKKSNRGKN